MSCIPPKTRLLLYKCACNKYAIIYRVASPATPFSESILPAVRAAMDKHFDAQCYDDAQCSCPKHKKSIEGLAKGEFEAPGMIAHLCPTNSSFHTKWVFLKDLAKDDSDRFFIIGDDNFVCQMSDDEVIASKAFLGLREDYSSMFN